MKILAPIFLTVALLVLTGCENKKTGAKSSLPVPVLTAQAVCQNVPVLINPPPVGHIQPVSTVTIRPQIGGVINAVNFQEGQAVRQGDLLFTIDPRPAQAALTLAHGNLQRDEALLKNSQIQFDRDQKLFAQALIAQDALDTSRAELDTLVGTVAADRAAVTNAELNLGYTEIRAPMDGVTGSVQFHAGNVVKSPDDVLLTINRIHPIYATFAVPEQYLPAIKVQQSNHSLPVTASYENMPGEPPAGELTFVDNAVDASTGTIQLKATFPNADEQLWPGQFVQIKLQLAELTNAVVVPSQAVQTGQTGAYVYVVNSDATVAERPVQTGVTVQGVTVVQSGVQAGETVVTDGQLRLVPGAKVSLQPGPK